MLTPGSMSDDYWTSLLKSTFCLATTGTGWGSRFKVRAARGSCALLAWATAGTTVVQLELLTLKWSLRL